MKVIELLMEGRKVWDINKKGYFVLNEDKTRLYYIDINTKRQKCYPTIKLSLALREGEVYKEG